MQLSVRMQRLASLVTEGNRLADVGCDHAYLPIALIQEGKIPSAVAMDVNQGPLLRAKEHVHACGLDTYIALRRSDGLAELRPGEADTVLIAGMGGMLMRRILSGGSHCLGLVRELVLQPQSEIHLVRRWLAQNGFCITDEEIVLDAGKYYPMFRAVPGDGGTPDEAELIYGNPALQRSPEVWRDYLQKEQQKTEQILRMLSDGGRESARGQELLERQELLLHLLKRMDRQE